MTALQISSTTKFHPRTSTCVPVYAIKYEDSLCPIQCGGCGRCLACDLGFSSHFVAATNSCTMGLQIALLGAPTSLASTMVIGPHYAAATYVGGAPKRASRSTWFSKVLQLEVGLSFCVLVAMAISPRCGKLGSMPRGMRPSRRRSPPLAAFAPRRRACGRSWFGMLRSQRPVSCRGTCGFR
jgi:hypothetical protein